MTIEELREYFGSWNKAAIALGINRQSFTYWRRCGQVPIIQQYRYEILTNGKLTADDELLNIARERNSKLKRKEIK